MRAKRDRPSVIGLEHMGRLKTMRCICCTLLDRKQEQITDVHHIREERTARNDMLTIPLCWDCHQGANGIHGDKTYLRILKMSEWDLLASTWEIMLRQRALPLEF